MNGFLLQTFYLGHPIIALYLFTGLYIAMLVGTVILHKIGKISRHAFWRYFAALHLIMLPFIIISLLTTLGIIPAGILDSIIRWLDFWWP